MFNTSLNTARSEAATLCQQMETLTAQVAAMNAANSKNNQHDTNTRGGGRGSGRPCGHGCGCGAFCQCRNISHYCWTHRACNHTGYKPEATFENKLGGSTYYCQIIDNNNNGDNG